MLGETALFLSEAAARPSLKNIHWMFFRALRPQRAVSPRPLSEKDKKKDKKIVCFGGLKHSFNDMKHSCAIPRAYYRQRQNEKERKT